MFVNIIRKHANHQVLFLVYFVLLLFVKAMAEQQQPEDNVPQTILSDDKLSNSKDHADLFKSLSVLGAKNVDKWNNNIDAYTTLALSQLIDRMKLTMIAKHFSNCV